MDAINKVRRKIKRVRMESPCEVMIHFGDPDDDNDPNWAIVNVAEAEEIRDALNAVLGDA